MADKNDFNSLPERANKARGAVNNLSSAFEDLSKNGTLTHRSMSAFAGALGAIPTPATAVAGLMLSVASGFLKSAEAADRLREQEIAKEMEAIADAADQAVDRVSAFRDSMLSGDTIFEAQIAQQISEIATEYVKLEAETRKRIETQKKEQEAAANSVAVGNDLAASITRWSDGVFAADQITEDMAFSQAVLNTKLVDARNKIAALKETLDRYHDSLKPAKDATNDMTAALAALATVLSSVGDTFSYDFPITTVEIETINAFTGAIDQAGRMAEYALGQVGAAAFDRYATAMDRVIDNQNAFSASAGRKFQNASAEILRALGRDAAARAVYHLAQAAAGSAGVLNTAIYGTPPENLKAAALFGTVAVMAGVGAGALSVKGGGGGGSGRDRDRDAGGSGRTLNLSLTVIGTLDSAQRRNLFAQLSQEFAESQ